MDDGEERIRREALEKAEEERRASQWQEWVRSTAVLQGKPGRCHFQTILTATRVVFCSMLAPGGVSAGGREDGGGDVGGPVGAHQRVPEGAADAHADPGPDPVLQSQTSQPRRVPGNHLNTAGPNCPSVRPSVYIREKIARKSPVALIEHFHSC